MSYVCVAAGYLAEKRGVDVSEVVAGGPGLVFESLPEAFALMPAPGAQALAPPVS